MAQTGAIGAVTREEAPGGVIKVTIPWVSDAAAGSVGEHGVALPGGTLLQFETIPDGEDAPTDDYDVTLLDAIGGADMLFGAGADRDTANTEVAVPVFGSTPHRPYLEGGTYYPGVANAGNSKAGTLILWIARGLVTP